MLPFQPSADWLYAFAVVFGKVVEGMALVRKAEATGTQSGKPRQPVLIADSGEVCCIVAQQFLQVIFCCTSAGCWDTTAFHNRGPLESSPASISYVADADSIAGQCIFVKGHNNLPLHVLHPTQHIVVYKMLPWTQAVQSTTAKASSRYAPHLDHPNMLFSP